MMINPMISPRTRLSAKNQRAHLHAAPPATECPPQLGGDAGEQAAQRERAEAGRRPGHTTRPLLASTPCPEQGALHLQSTRTNCETGEAGEAEAGFGFKTDKDKTRNNGRAPQPLRQCRVPLLLPQLLRAVLRLSPRPRPPCASTHAEHTASAHEQTSARHLHLIPPLLPQNVSRPTPVPCPPPPPLAKIRPASHSHCRKICATHSSRQSRQAWNAPTTIAAQRLSTCVRTPTHHSVSTAPSPAPHLAWARWGAEGGQKRVATHEAADGLAARCVALHVLQRARGHPDLVQRLAAAQRLVRRLHVAGLTADVAATLLRRRRHTQLLLLLPDGSHDAAPGCPMATIAGED
jgi:hypothetical protein